MGPPLYENLSESSSLGRVGEGTADPIALT